MNVLPKSKAQWLRLLVLPFHVYVVAAFALIKCLGAVIPHQSKYGFPYGAYGIPIGPILLGYMLCFVVLISYGIHCVRHRGGEDAFTAFLFAALALLFAYALLPPLAAA
jgi:hypothetical protein